LLSIPIYLPNTNKREVDMQINKIFGKAMVEKEIKGYKQLSELSGVSYEKTIRIMKNAPSAKMVDVVSIATSLGLKLKFVLTE
tara:strand:+ start:85 stop:333 length:249 start_codon:yes stop_codon:yes gene_type:complete